MMLNSTSFPAVRIQEDATVYYIPYQYGSLIGPEKQWDEEWAYHFFKANWSHSIWIAVLYSCAVHLGEKAMADRKPFKLKWPLIIWNAALAIFSLAGTIRMAEEFSYVLTNFPLLDSISYAVDPKEPAAFWAGLFAASKLFELLDTAFVVARKKPLIFLHWYHHAVVLVYVWHSACELVAGGRWFITMNYGVHALMYAYYALTAAGIRLPRSFSMVITTLQTTQMLIGVAISFAVLHYKLQGRIMQQSYENLLLCFAIYSSFAVLFMNFFHKSYLKKREKSKTA
ncbi:hypothetical protein PRIPAC_91114 [Pristionchus pacificus]|uniref:Elongation of very long chain fatty acids protein n=1 Tax=Pristionchus pacificus TaxID=54126 RepID=A0A2A6CYP5_PRIPA|nr:hypothetical protein PRIPAC_91114 [Pristionchus pacificus]|eukprot:PDM83332.1 hypothetical protein PRIPAC_34964 [Pristionchus pacificus]